MKPKWLLNLILLVVLAVLAGVAFFEPGKEGPKTVYLTDLDVAGLERFELRNQETLVFAKQDGRWRLTAPFAAPANEIRVRQLLNIAKAESRARYPLKADELAKFGLDKPKAVLALGPVKLVFGGSEPIDMLRYVQVGETLHLVADDFSHHLSAKATDYVDKKLLPEDAKLKEIILPGLKASLGGKGQWNLEPPGDAAAMVELANAWASARAIEVKRHETAQQNGPEQKSPQGDVARFVFADGQTVEYLIVQREPDLLLVRLDWQLEYMVAGEAGKRLLGLQKPGADADDRGQDDEDTESPPEQSPEDALDYEPGEDVDSADGE